MRLPEFDETKLTAAQKEVYDRIASGPRGGVRGPFKAFYTHQSWVTSSKQWVAICAMVALCLAICENWRSW